MIRLRFQRLGSSLPAVLLERIRRGVSFVSYNLTFVCVSLICHAAPTSSQSKPPTVDLSPLVNVVVKWVFEWALVWLIATLILVLCFGPLGVPLGGLFGLWLFGHLYAGW
ncbi:hypothetical protein [Beijerinckia mobilis]|uniref:hypothetical protein n=1 Tax=Beijerinckia mobilis TaxID=231434 RepID=UPI0012EB3FB8|nr:hypothetical protein [Beijerinckia mobilis]